MSESSPTAGREATTSDGTGDGTSLGRRDLVRAGLGAAAVTGAAAASAPAAAQAYGGWLSDVSNYEGTMDYTGRDEVTVDVGVGEDGFLFGPSAILVDPGTRVVWEWTGKGVPHNVVHEPEAEGGQAAFESELIDEAGVTFEYDFEETGTFKYFCSPHRALGMKGVVAVGETDDEVVDPGGDGGGGDGGDDGGDGGSLSTSDFLVLGSALGLGVALVAAVLSAAEPPGAEG